MTDDLNINDVGEIIAPDGLRVRPLIATKRGSMAEFRLAPGLIGRTIKHRTIEEIWYVVAGDGWIWRETTNAGEPVLLASGSNFHVPPGCAFQIRAGAEELVVIATTMPPWPGDDEVEVLENAGPWIASL